MDYPVLEVDGSRKVVFVTNAVTDYRLVLPSLGCLRKDGLPYKTAKINESASFSFDGSPYSHKAVSIEYKGKTTYVISSSVRMECQKNDMNALLNDMTAFGKRYRLNFAGNSVRGPVSIERGMLSNGDQTFSIMTGSGSINMSTQLLNTITGNSNKVLAPLMSKMHNIVRYVGRNAIYLTGYINLNNYLTYLGMSSLGKMPPSVAGSMGTYVFDTAGNTLIFYYKVRSVSDGVVNVDIELPNGVLRLAGSGKKAVPFMLVSLTPAFLRDKKIPVSRIRVGKMTLYVSVLMLENPSILKDLKGGVDLTG